MKRKRLTCTFFVLLAALIITGGLSVTAHAETPQTTPEETLTDDSGVKVNPQPLTPEGNMTIVDEIEGDAAGDKSFIVVQSSGGNYFYIIIDHAAEGENTVHFLNQVDEQDLLSIIDEDGGMTEVPAICICNDKCIVGDINTNCPVCKNDMTKCCGTERIATPEPGDELTEQPAKSNTGGAIAVIVILALLGGGAVYYFKVFKLKQNTKGSTDLDEFDPEEWEGDEQQEVREEGEE